MKNFFHKLNQLIPAVTAAAGFPLIAYGVYFQTEGFKWVPLFYCVLCAAAAFTAAYFMMQYFEMEIVSGKAGAMASKSGSRSIVQGSWISFFVGMLVLYRCTSLLAFYVGLLVMLFSWGCLIFHYLLSKIYRKKAGKGRT